ncbi:MAG: hypothetical protein U1E65_27345 [Myxococcota bacterium]
MKIEDACLAAAGEANRRASKMAAEQAASIERQKAYDAIERELDQMTADGDLDPAELAKLKEELRAQGLDTGTLDALAQGLRTQDGVERRKATSAIRDALYDELEAKKRALPRLDPFAVQEVVAAYQNAMDMASRASKASSDNDMVAIRHLVA